MNTTYKFMQLDPRNILDAQVANGAIFASGKVLGIEVTIPVLAARCSLGNLDHHGRDAGKPAAIEQALTCELPPEGAVLATIRPDLDSVGAMAVLQMREEFGGSVISGEGCYLAKTVYEGGGISEVRVWATKIANPFTWPMALERIRKVAAADTGALLAASEWAPQELPTRRNPWPSSTAVSGNRELAAINAAVSDNRVSLEERVEVMKKWLLTGEEPADYREKVESERHDLIADLEAGKIAFAERDAEMALGGITVITAARQNVISLAYCQTPIAVICNSAFSQGGEEPYRKFTVCQFKLGYVNLPAVFAELSEKEAGWGGSAVAGGSPQGVSSELSIDDVVAVVKRHLANN